MKRILKQYKNLILLVVAVLLIIALIASDPLGFGTQRVYERAAVRNQMAVEKAKIEQEIAIIQAQTEAALLQIKNGEYVPDVTEEGD